MAAGRSRDALVAITEALQLVDGNHEAVLEPVVRLTFANVLLAGDTKEQVRAEEQLALALAQASGRGFPPLALRIACRFAQAIAERGERAQAHELLASVVAKFSGGIPNRDLTEAQFLLRAFG